MYFNDEGEGNFNLKDNPSGYGYYSSYVFNDEGEGNFNIKDNPSGYGYYSSYVFDKNGNPIYDEAGKHKIDMFLS